jgi:hypothetical protein
MKRICLMACFAVLLSLVNVSCNKPIETPSTSLPTPTPIQNVWTHANMNITIELPMNFTILNGRTTGPGATASKVKWEKISGPASYFLESPDSAKTKVTNLEKGVYEFKLSAINNTGQTSSDTMTLIVQDPTSPNRQIIFGSLNWSCPVGCSVHIVDALSYLPSNGPFTLYIRREFSSNWELVVPEFSSSSARFTYTVWGGHINVLEISNVAATDHPEIKIVF